MALPATAGGAHWIRDALGRDLVFAEGAEGRWTIEPAEGLAIRGLAPDARPMLTLDPARFSAFNLDAEDGSAWCVVCYPDSDASLTGRLYGFAGSLEMSIGRASDNDIIYASGFVSGHHARLAFQAGVWTLTDTGSTNGTFVNGERVPAGESRYLAFGDTVSILGFNITVGNAQFSCNNPNGLVKVGAPGLVRYRAPRQDEGAPAKLAPRPAFFPALRFARSINEKSFAIDPPTSREKPDETPLIMRMGPSLIMAMASLLSATMMIASLGEDASPLRAVPMASMAVAMLAGSVLWPIFNKRYQARQATTKERQRTVAYGQYLSSMRTTLANEQQLQREILFENRISVDECCSRAAALDGRLMNRTAIHADYLDIRIGLGSEPFVAQVRYPESRFSLDADPLRAAVDDFAREDRVIKGVPLAVSLIDQNVLGITGDTDRVAAYVRGIVVQIATLFSYEDVKLVVYCDQIDRDRWAFASHLPHCFSDDRKQRYFACGAEEAAQLDLMLERVLDARHDERFDARRAHPTYVVVCASRGLSVRSGALRSVMEERASKGIALITCARTMPDLPRGCRSVIELAEGPAAELDASVEDACLLNRDDPTGARRAFHADGFTPLPVAEAFSRNIARLHLRLADSDVRIPERLGFLEMLKLGSVDHLNIAARWRESNASTSLACVVGADEQGDPFVLNIHEKFHGPHGLIAGTTGSGKSEFIITYILSMALTYSPDEVAFVLIDYKGGGLAKAFDNKHVRLPHLAGVITNLDGGAIKRSLVSIQSELKRRQALFNRARDVVGGDNVDIYDYLNLYRQGRMTEPCPHLIIVADEFAELKQQQPDFMDELISAARIGRSLGVHLILATQKPSGVVNDQIWSNARFKVCLKVSDEGDSREMIKRPDAASLVQAGRFYLLVGYNEYFALGQAGYAGTPYAPQPRFTPPHDDSVALINDTGAAVVTVRPRLKASAEDAAPESHVLLERIEQAAQDTGVRARQLWLEPLPTYLSIDGVIERYGRPASAPGELAGVVGAYDDPAHQRQGLLSVSFTTGGSLLVYGTPDSGVEMLLSGLIYSLVCWVGPRALNVYAIDCGTESLRAFAAAPQVGDVVNAADDEKVPRLLGMLEAEYARRKKLLVPYGGSYQRYAQANDDLPAIVVVLNDIAAFTETFPKLEDRYVRLLRDSGRNGVYMVATAAGTSSVRLRMRSLFRQVLACDPVDASDYQVIFGSMRGQPQPHGFGRGLVRLDDRLLEFQAAHAAPADGEDEFAFIQATCEALAHRAEVDGEPVAPAVPTVPEHVYPKVLDAWAARDAADGNEARDRLAYGICEDTLTPAYLDFEEMPLSRVLFSRKRDGAAFTEALVRYAVHAGAAGGRPVAVLDMAKLLSGPVGAQKMETQRDQFAVSYLEELARQASTANDLVIVTGMMPLLNRIDLKAANQVKELLRTLSGGSGPVVVLCDSVDEAGYGFEPWFKAHLTNKDGIWVGAGMDAQTAISATYSVANPIDPKRAGAERAYEVQAGTPRPVRLVTREQEDLPKEQEA